MRSDKPWLPSIPEAQLQPCPRLPSNVVLNQLPGCLFLVTEDPHQFTETVTITAHGQVGASDP